MEPATGHQATTGLSTKAPLPERSSRLESWHPGATTRALKHAGHALAINGFKTIVHLCRSAGLQDRCTSSVDPFGPVVACYRLSCMRCVLSGSRRLSLVLGLAQRRRHSNTTRPALDLDINNASSIICYELAALRVICLNEQRQRFHYTHGIRQLHEYTLAETLRIGPPSWDPCRKRHRRQVHPNRRMCR